MHRAQIVQELGMMEWLYIILAMVFMFVILDNITNHNITLHM